jgi:hypothetical protein
VPASFKFGVLAEQRVPAPFVYPNVWERQTTTGASRLAIAASGRHIGLLVHLLRELEEPLALLYVLLVPRGDHEPARYQSPIPTLRRETEEFLQQYAGYLEGDGRHHIWVHPHTDQATLVYDQHNLIYAYGDLDRYEGVLLRAGLSRGQVNVPAPHVHQYNEEFDAAEDRILRHWAWTATPLQAGDEG